MQTSPFSTSADTLLSSVHFDLTYWYRNLLLRDGSSEMRVDMYVAFTVLPFFPDFLEFVPVKGAVRVACAVVQPVFFVG